MHANRIFHKIQTEKAAGKKIASITVTTEGSNWTSFGDDYSFDEYVLTVNHSKDKNNPQTVYIPMDKIAKVVAVWQ